MPPRIESARQPVSPEERMGRVQQALTKHVALLHEKVLGDVSWTEGSGVAPGDVTDDILKTMHGLHGTSFDISVGPETFTRLQGPINSFFGSKQSPLRREVGENGVNYFVRVTTPQGIDEARSQDDVELRLGKGSQGFGLFTEYTNPAPLGTLRSFRAEHLSSTEVLNIFVRE